MIERRVIKVGFVFDRPSDMATNELDRYKSNVWRARTPDITNQKLEDT